MQKNLFYINKGVGFDTFKNSTRNKTPNAIFCYFNFFIKSNIVCLLSSVKWLYKSKTFLSSLL